MSDCNRAQGQRKRSHNGATDPEDLPIAKRIKHLTLDGNQGPLQHSLSASSGSELPEMDCTNDQSAITRQSHAMHLQQQLIQEAQQQEDVGIKYEPELNRTLNPHYYDINKVLFDAHLQRLQRSQEN